MLDNESHNGKNASAQKDKNRGDLICCVQLYFFIQVIGNQRLFVSK